MIRFLLCSFALVLLYPTAIDLYLVGLPQIAADLNASEAQLHIAFSIYLAGMAATMLFAGRLADTLGRKPVAVVGAVIFVLASWLGGAVENSTSFLIARFLQGIGAGTCYVIAFAILRDILDDQKRAKVLSMLNGITCVVPVIAPVVGHLIMLQYPWPSLFTTMASMGLVVLALSVLVLKETLPTLTSLTSTVKTPSESAHVAATQATSTQVGGEGRAESNISSETFFERFFVSRVVITSIGVATILTYVNVSPMLVMNNMGFDRGGYSTVMALTALVSMLTSFSAPLALTIFKEKTLMLTAQVLFFGSAVVLTAAHLNQLDNVYSFVGFGLLCAGFSIGFGVTMSQALSPYSLRAGVASSILGVVQVCGSALYIWFMGLLGVSAVSMLVVILALGSVISMALILLVPKSNVSGQYEEIVSPT